MRSYRGKPVSRNCGASPVSGGSSARVSGSHRNLSYRAAGMAGGRALCLRMTDETRIFPKCTDGHRGYFPEMYKPSGRAGRHLSLIPKPKNPRTYISGIFSVVTALSRVQPHPPQPRYGLLRRVLPSGRGHAGVEPSLFFGVLPRAVTAREGGAVSPARDLRKLGIN